MFSKDLYCRNTSESAMQYPNDSSLRKGLLETLWEKEKIQVTILNSTVTVFLFLIYLSYLKKNKDIYHFLFKVTFFPMTFFSQKLWFFFFPWLYYDFFLYSIIPFIWLQKATFTTRFWRNFVMNMSGINMKIGWVKKQVIWTNHNKPSMHQYFFP